MSEPQESFFFVKHPSYHSFALIQVRGEVPEEIPEEVLHLMPGNKSGRHDKAIVLEKDEGYLKSVMHGCADWFTELEQKAWNSGRWSNLSSGGQMHDAIRFTSLISYKPCHRKPPLVGGLSFYITG